MAWLLAEKTQTAQRATVSNEYGYDPAKPSAPVDAAWDLLHGLFPQNAADRARAARHLALLIERWDSGNCPLALRERWHSARLDEHFRRRGPPPDYTEVSIPLNAPYIDNPGSVTDQADDEDNGAAGDPQR
jgi:hypothetical protein